ncbi:hypothetical protein GCM10011399_33100 [Subtercola lobariae]|uniref:Uncharacterized protein n=1 Tax=Subtercola lobariae TaxID=1588641 RepID=A0A917BG33_9MICO|nr:hypothetical protein GCM10011399_33100 [Subtercola lobariae]
MGIRSLIRHVTKKIEKNTTNTMSNGRCRNGNEAAFAGPCSGGAAGAAAVGLVVALVSDT